MKKIKVLDCTLRDGGYINNWAFGDDSSKEIISSLINANIDLIEIGFLNKIANESQTLFNSFEKIKNFIPKNINTDKLLLMVNPKDFEIKDFPNANNSLIKNIRLIFKKEQTEIAFKYCQNLKEKNYNLFINPTFINQYNKKEFISLIKKINNIDPSAFSIVDSMGTMSQDDVSSYFALCDEFLNKNISICFHLHNNLQLAFSNVQHLIKLNKTRNLIIDSSILGMGRGAGNLNSELICQHLNKNYDYNYNISALLEIINNKINPIFNKTPWGYNIAYFLCAINCCHPNYAKFLIEKNTPVSKIDLILKSIPENKKYLYDKNLIENLEFNN